MQAQRRDGGEKYQIDPNIASTASSIFQTTDFKIQVRYRSRFWFESDEDYV
jgi:hypothetical protein